MLKLIFIALHFWTQVFQEKPVFQLIKHVQKGTIFVYKQQEWVAWSSRQYEEPVSICQT